MDNLTHSLVGLALGELTHRLLPAPPDASAASTRRRLLLTSAALASNFPDLDLVLTPLAPAPLGYLLHHRGHTHTLLYALPQALLLLAALWLCWPAARALLRTDAATRRGLAAAIVAGLLLHFGMDALNVYGIHPFAPFDPRWYYGDAVFIVEPVFWVALGTPLAAHVARRGWRRLLLGLLLVVPLLFTLKGFLQWGSYLLLAALWALALVLTRRLGERAALLAGVAVTAGFVLLQGAMAGQAREALRAALRQHDPAAQILDLPLSAFPANPLCWGAIAITREGADAYRIRRGVLSLAPGIAPAASCPPAIGGVQVTEGTAPVAWAWEEQGSIAALRGRMARDCRFEAWLRFARAPSLAKGGATDVRFGIPGAPNFSTLPIDTGAATACPRHVPQWGFPRADLLGLH
ncbi:metal-dependent hydrolase [Massilia suwonensis]|uniref:Metal-dependent hydrolase n=1 Tax=Massilia suwonensis TaxID=648895 RepID=A0ABW0MP91_9BURK